MPPLSSLAGLQSRRGDLAVAAAVVVAVVSSTDCGDRAERVTGAGRETGRARASTLAIGRKAPPAGRPKQARNAEAAGLIGAAGLAWAAPAGYGLTGAGVRVGVWDEGHARASHVDLAGRVEERDLGGWVEHATHTTVTVAGSGTGDAAARGLAPSARVWAFDWWLDQAEMLASAPALAVSSSAYGPALGWGASPACPGLANWWGADGAREDAAFGRYGHEAAAVDAIAVETDLLTVWPIGNERSDVGAADGAPHAHGGVCDVLYEDRHLQETTLQYGTLGGAAVAKNGLTVGAVREVPPEALTPARVLPIDMSAFGPTRDGRIKPDLVAMADAVRSASDAGDEAYATASGTSSATAVTAGVVALLTELYRRTHDGTDPLGVELKALLVHTAFDAGEPGPDYRTGYGLLDAAAAAAQVTADADARFRVMHAAAVHDGETLRWQSEEIAVGEPVRVTLAWNDPPAERATGMEATSRLVNDLDLVVRAPGGTTFHPWSLDASDPGASATRGARNRDDNVEVIDVAPDENTQAGRWTIEVSATRKLVRGRPQTFALVSSVPVDAPLQKVLGAPRYVEVEVPLGQDDAAVIEIPLAHRGGERVVLDAVSRTPWLALRPASAGAPTKLVVELDATGFARPGEYLGTVELGATEGVAPRRVGVVARVTCTPDCAGRRCGLDPRCGAQCGRCGSGLSCDDGACVSWQSRCPHVSLGADLGTALLHGPLEASGREQGSCGGEGGGDVGVAWTAPEAGRFAFTTRGSAFDTMLYARAAACDGAELACNDDSSDRTSAFSLGFEAGERMTVFVDAVEDSGAREFRLNVQRAPCPDVDLGSRLGQLVARASTVGGLDDLRGACGGEGSEDVAFAWRAPAAGRYRFALFDPDYRAVLHVRNGDCNGVELGCSAGTDGASVELVLTEGQEVTIAVDGRAGRAGEFTLDVLDLERSCVGVCEARPVDGDCGCDEACVGAGDCCADACAACGRCRCDADCQGRLCGDDGCGGSCGRCAPGDVCDDGRCAPDPCAGTECAPCQVCEAGRCAALPEGAPCEDGDLCTVVDACRGGVCEGEPRDCDDGLSCSTDRCDARTGACSHLRTPGCCEMDVGRENPRERASIGDECLPEFADGGVSGDGGMTRLGRGTVDPGCGCAIARSSAGSTPVRARLGAILSILAYRARRGRRHRRCTLAQASV